MSHEAAELAARASYGKLLAYLATWSRDVAAAEDALGDAFLGAVDTWPRTGVPDKPEAWLLAVARRRLIDGVRHAKVEDVTAAALRIVVDRAEQEASAKVLFPDERLKLLFVCAHPAIDPAARTPLMLQTALGLDDEGVIRIAPTIGARVGAAAALAEARGPGAGLTALEAIPPDAVSAYQPYWALSAHLLDRVGRGAEAREASARALGLSEDPAVREFLMDRFDRAPDSA